LRARAEARVDATQRPGGVFKERRRRWTLVLSLLSSSSLARALLLPIRLSLLAPRGRVSRLYPCGITTTLRPPRSRHD
jgi:hypothetical protein